MTGERGEMYSGPCWRTKLVLKFKLPEIRGLVLASIILQVILALYGRARKCSKSKTLFFLLWSAYLLADAVAITVLSLVVSCTNFIKRYDTDEQDCTRHLIAVEFWSPFLLLHLGGPDAITALSLEDNTLSWRRFLGLMFQTGMTGFILIRLAFILYCLPLFVAGFFKYLERILCLMSASFQNRRHADFMFPSNGSIEDYQSRFAHDCPPNILPIQKQYYHMIYDAHYLFQNFKRVFVNLSIDQQSIHELGKHLLTERYKDWKEVFKVIEIELQLLFDELFTKPLPHHAIWRFFVKIFNFCSIFTVFYFFSRVVVSHSEDYFDTDTVITCILFGGALVLEIYQGIHLLLNDWMIIGLMKQHKCQMLRSLVLKAIPLSWLDLLKEPPRWSNSMGQCNLLTICLYTPDFELWPELESFFKKMRLLWIRDILDQFWRIRVLVTYRSIDDELKELILKHLRERVSSWEAEQVMGNSKEDLFRSFLDTWGKLILQKHNWQEYDEFTTLEIDHSILVWHIATEICYHQDSSSTSNHHPSSNQCILSKYLSEYLFYLLFHQPTIVTPKFIPDKLIKEGCKVLQKELETEPGRIIETESEACHKLYGNGNDHPREKIDWKELKKQPSSNINISVIQVACTIAKDLMRENLEKRWEIIRDMWLEMLVYVADHCPRECHAAQLAKGGELITHVWLLMTHLGISTPCAPAINHR